MTIATTTDLRGLSADACVYGLPLVSNLDRIERFTTPAAMCQGRRTFNQFNHIRTLAGPRNQLVSVNNDTIYSVAHLDLSSGPVLLELPDTNGRYYVMQFISAWTENFAYVGRRATGTKPQRYLVVGPQWQDQRSDRIASASVIRSPTAICSIVGRWAVNGVADLEEVNRLQDATMLTPLPIDEPRGLAPVTTTDTDEALTFWEKYRIHSQTFAPPKRDWNVQAGFASLGLTAQAPVTELAADIRVALVDGYSDAHELIDRQLRHGRGATDNGWTDTLTSFDYNLDHFEIGAIDESRWKITDPERRLLSRAGTAVAGPWGCHAYEAAYFTAYADERGQHLNGAHDYELTLNPPPPHGAFWSLTMYDDRAYLLVPNAIDRYSVGDRTPGLITSADGTVTVTISRVAPHDAGGRANWLPAPQGGFRPMLRIYQPDASVTDGDYVVPAIRRVR